MVNLKRWLICSTLVFVLALPVFAAVVPGRSTESIAKLLKADLKARKSSSFESILSDWEKTYGSDAVNSLMTIASDRTNSDPDRYIAVMGMAKLGGISQASRLTSFLKDPSWMLRSGSLRALAALRNPAASSAVLPLLKDKALVVRLEAVNAVERLQPAGAPQALIDALYDESNYHAGKAQWVPQRALAALVGLKARDAAPKLAKLLDRYQDPELQRQAVITMEALRGKRLKSDRPLAEQIKAWKAELSSL